MVTGGVISVVNVSSNVIDTSAELIYQLGKIGLWMQALGIVVVLWIVFQIISLVISRKRIKEIYLIKEDMKRIESKIDSLIEKKKIKSK